MRTDLTVIGLVLLVIGLVTAVFCVGIPIAIVGLILLIVGLVTEEPRPYVAYGPPPAYGVPAVAPCPVCRGPLVWVAQYGRWYCPACAAYR